MPKIANRPVEAIRQRTLQHTCKNAAPSLPPLSPDLYVAAVHNMNAHLVHRYEHPSRSSLPINPRQHSLPRFCTTIAVARAQQLDAFSSAVAKSQSATTISTSFRFCTTIAVASAQQLNPFLLLIFITTKRGTFSPLICTPPQYTTTPIRCIVADQHATNTAYLDFALHRRRTCTTTGCLLFRCCQITIRDKHLLPRSAQPSPCRCAQHDHPSRSLLQITPRQHYLPSFRFAQPSPSHMHNNWMPTLPLLTIIL